MRKFGVPLLAIVIGIAIGFLIAAPRPPAAEAEVPGTGFAAIPGEKGGQDLFGGYEPVEGWPKPLSTMPGHDGWTHGAAQGIYPESADRVFMVQRGELPDLQRPEEAIPVPGYRHGIVFPAGPGGTFRNASGVSPGNGNAEGIVYNNGELGVDARWEHNIMVVNREGDFIEAEVWSQWDNLFRRPHSVYINPYDPERHVWVVDDTGHSIRKFSNDGQTLVQTLGTPYESGNDASHFNRPTFLAWLPDSTLFVADGYANTRVVKFDAQGNYVMAWGERGTPPTEQRPGYFNSVHGIAVDPESRRVFVNDRTNRRVQVFDENGTFIDQWNYGRAGTSDAHSIYMGNDGALWVVDRTSHKMVKYNQEGNLLYSWGTFGEFPGGFWGVHQISVDQEGNLYTAAVNAGVFQKYRPRPGVNPAVLIAPAPVPAS